MEERDDPTLLEGIARRRDPAAYAELFSRYEKRAYSLALHLTRNQDLAQDAVQNAMLEIWQQASTFRPGNAAGWIMRIVANKSLTLARQRNRDDQRMHEPVTEEPPGRLPSPFDLTMQEELLRALREALEKLPLTDGQVLALHYAGGLTQAEIGEALSLSQGAIGNRLAKACSQIRAYLTQAGYLAALPLVSPAGLGAAYASGFEAPPELRRRVLEEVTRSSTGGPRMGITRPARPGASKPFRTTLLAGGLALAASGVLALALLQGPGTHLAPGDPASNGAASEPVAHPGPSKGGPREAGETKTLFRRWTFERGAPQDLEVRDGRWRWDGGKRMVAEGEMAILLFPMPPPRKPFLVQTRLAILPTGERQNGTLWTDGLGLLPFRRHYPGDLAHAQPGGMAVYREYFVGVYRIVCLGEQVVSICEAVETGATARLCLGLQGMLAEEILVRTLEEHELPAGLKDPQALIARLGWPVQEMPAQPFPPPSDPRR